MNVKNEWIYAIRKSIPVFFGYIFLGIAFGLLLQHTGYDWPWALLISLLVYAGSLQFAMVGFLAGGTDPITVILMSLLINSRHIFYGVSFLDRFRRMGHYYPYMIFSLTDETYSLFCSRETDPVPSHLDEDKVMFRIALLDHIYWVTGSVLGGLVGEFITFDTTGIDFAMTALFVVIFLDQWKEARNHTPAIIGLVSSVLFLLLLGPDHFILPSLAVTTALLMLLRRKLS